MAKVKAVTSVPELINNNIDRFIESNTQDYVAFQSKAPLFVTYYSKSMYASTFDTEFIAHNEVVGSESPNKFHKVDNFPIYDIDIADFTQEETEAGRYSEITTTCTILPDTVVPMYDDQILIAHQTKKYLFTVTNIVPDNYNNKKYYKLSIKLSQYTVDNIERQVDKQLEVQYDLLGKTNKPIVEKNYSRAMSDIKSVYDEMLDIYSDTFYSNTLQLYINKENDVCDQFLNYFISKTNINKPFLDYRNARFINPKVIKMIDKKKYSESIFYQYGNLLFDFSRVEKEIALLPYDGSYYGINYFFSDRVRFIEPLSLIDNSGIDLSTLDVNDLTGEQKKQIAAVMLSRNNNETYKIPDSLLMVNVNNITVENDKFIVAYISYMQEVDLVVKRTKLDELISYIPNLDIDYNSNYINYYTTAILLHILKDIYNILSNV